MACCALAAFLVSQIIFGLDWVRDRLGLGAPAAMAANPVVAWRLDGAGAGVLAPPRHAAGWRGRLALAAAGGAAAFLLLAGLTLRAEAGAHPKDPFGVICTAHGLEPWAGLSGG